MLILVWFIVCIIFAFVQLILGDSGHALELFALLSAIALFLISKIKYKINRNLNYSDLKIDNPFNTYKINGLPPQPISYVGSKTIELIMENYKTNYLFYFYDTFEKKHIFSKNYKNHIKKLNEYRK